MQFINWDTFRNQSKIHSNRKWFYSDFKKLSCPNSFNFYPSFYNRESLKSWIIWLLKIIIIKELGCKILSLQCLALLFFMCPRLEQKIWLFEIWTRGFCWLLNVIEKFFGNLLTKNYFHHYVFPSAHWAPNFTNPKYFVCLLFEYFFQIKVLNQYQNTPKKCYI